MMATMKALLLAALVATAWSKEFKVTDGQKTCILLSVSGSVALEAFNGSTSLGSKTLDFEKASVLNGSDCSVIKLDMMDSTQVWFKVANATAGSQSVVPVSTFVPSTVFGEKVNDTAPVFQGSPLGTFTADQSFSCMATVTHSLSTTTVTTYNYTAVVSTSNMQVQFGNINNDTFSSGPHCSEDDPTTTTAPASTTTAPASTTTAVPEPPVNDFNVTNGNLTCIKLDGAFKMDITYLAGKVNQTYSAVVPKTATATGNCALSANTSSISIEFDLGLGGSPWLLQYTFSVADDKKSYWISEIALTYGNLPNATSPGAVTEKYTADPDYLKATTDGYYMCNADQTVTFQGVSLTSVNFKYTAFNDKAGKPLDFSGDVMECSADDETSSVVPIAVGAALAGLVVIVLVAYLIGRRRSRKSGYESV